MVIKPKHAVEIITGMFQIYAQFIGSTTLIGSSLYEVVTVSWWIWMFTWKMWGFLPLNVAGAIISTWDLWKALQ